MLNLEVTKRIEFSCCYIYEGTLDCHNCKLETTVKGPQRFKDHGTVISYDTLSRYMKETVPDKSFLYFKDDPSGCKVGNSFREVGCKVAEYPFPISAENLCNYFAEYLQNIFDTREPGIQIIDLKLREDNYSFVSWHK